MQMADQDESPNAVERYARAVEQAGPCWKKSADAIRTGFRNCWIEAGIKALEQSEIRAA